MSRRVIRQAHRVHRDGGRTAGRPGRSNTLGHRVGPLLALVVAVLVALAALSMTSIPAGGNSQSGDGRSRAAMLDSEEILGQTGRTSQTAAAPSIATRPSPTAPTPQPSATPTSQPSATPSGAPSGPTESPGPSSVATSGRLGNIADRRPTSTTLHTSTAAPQQHPATPLRMVALGDSLTAWPEGNPWPSRVDAADPYVTLVHNAGVPGNTTSQMRARFGGDVSAYSPDLLLVLGGTNDVGTGVGQGTTIANLRAIVRAAKAQGIRVVLVTIPPDSYSSYVGRVQALNAAIRGLAASEGVPLIDIYWPLATSGGVYRAGYTVDGLHFSGTGAQVVANTIRAGLASLGF